VTTDYCKEQVSNDINTKQQRINERTGNSKKLRQFV